jgi:hypothetical protein
MMRKRRKIDVETAVTLYTVQHLTCAEIGRILGVSRFGIWKALKSAGVNSRDGEWVECVCAQCGGPFNKPRSRWRKQRNHFCTEQCYFDSLANPAYNYSRQGQRVARKVVSLHFDLVPGYVVHHWDSNTENNELKNLAVFESNAQHMSFERGGNDRPIWDGRKRGKY